MNIKHFSILTMTLVLAIQSCQPVASRRETVETAQPDSALYYRQSDIDDPFLDTIFQEPDKAIALNTRLYPPPPVEPQPEKFRTVDGFRVQIIAGTDSLEILNTSRSLPMAVKDSVYYFYDKGLYKIHLGDFQYHYKADSLKTVMRRNGYPGAWVARTIIRIPIDTTPAVTISPVPADSIQTAVEGKYKIQVAALSSDTRAEEIISQLKSLLSQNAFYEKSGSVYKIFVGPFESESDARQQLNKVRENGYPDAWLVY